MLTHTFWSNFIENEKKITIVLCILITALLTVVDKNRPKL